MITLADIATYEFGAPAPTAPLEEYRLDLVDRAGELREVVFLDTPDRAAALADARDHLASTAGCVYGHLYTTDGFGEIYVDTVARPGEQPIPPAYPTTAGA